MCSVSNLVLSCIRWRCTGLLIPVLIIVPQKTVGTVIIIELKSEKEHYNHSEFMFLRNPHIMIAYCSWITAISASFSGELVEVWKWSLLTRFNLWCVLDTFSLRKEWCPFPLECLEAMMFSVFFMGSKVSKQRRTPCIDRPRK